MDKSKEMISRIITYCILILFSLLTLLPLGWILSSSIKRPNEIYATPPVWIPKSPTLSNYMQVLMESSIPKAFLNSLLVGLMVAIFSLVIGGFSAYAFSRYNFRGKNFLSIFLLLSQMFPLTVLMIPMFYMENSMGLIDTKIGLVIAQMSVTLPMVIWMCRGYFNGLPKELDEAAKIDGCGKLGTLARILLPLMRPSLAATGIYAFISSWNEYPLANVLTRTENSKTVPLALNDFSSFFEVNWGQTMAAAALITLPIIILFLIVQKEFVAGLASGAVKG